MVVLNQLGFDFVVGAHAAVVDPALGALQEPDIQHDGLGTQLVEDSPELRVEPSASGRDVRSKVEAKMREIDDKIAGLEEMKEALADLTTLCSGDGTVGECPILEALEANAER